jgi:hypothetical protein
MNYNITEKAMLASLHIRAWNARKHDVRVSKEVDNQYSSQNAGRFNKLLASKESLKAIQTAISGARTFHHEQTLPWGERGERLLPSKNYSHYSGQMRRYKQAFDEAVDNFVNNYSNVIMEARKALGGLFQPEDYPLASEIRDKFAFESAISPVPVSDDFRVNIGQEAVEAIKADLQKRLEAANSAATQDLWKRLYEVVSHMVERLSDPEAVFRDSLVGNIVKLTELLPRLNLNDDPGLEQMRRQIEATLCDYSPEQLRQDKTVRKEAVDNAKSVLDLMSGYVEEVAA